MKIKSIIMPVVIGTSALFTSCEKQIQKQVANTIPNIECNMKFQTILKDTFSNILSDEHKVIEYNKILKEYNKNVDNYVVIDKNKCVSKVYNASGDLLYECEVALGRSIGDKRSGGTRGLNVVPYTTPGEFVVRKVGTTNAKNQKLYGDRIMILDGDHTLDKYKKIATLALHRVPSTSQGRLRESVIGNKTLKDNRVSLGCVNYLVESYDKMRKLIKGTGTKVYILPEEKGNSLHLEKQKDGSYKFFQTKYRYESQEKNKKRLPIS